MVDTDALVLDELGDGRFGRRRLEQLDLRLAQLEERRADFLVGNLFDRITFQTQYVFPIGNRLIQTFDCNAKMLNVRYFIISRDLIKLNIVEFEFSESSKNHTKIDEISE